MRLLLYVLVFAAAPLGAQPVLGEPFFDDGSAALPDTPITLSDRAGTFEAEGTERFRAMRRSVKAAADETTFRMQGAELDDDGHATLTIQRDASDQVRLATYAVFDDDSVGLGDPASEQEIVHVFDAAGRTVGLFHKATARAPEICDEAPRPFEQVLLFAEDQRLLMLLTQTGPGGDACGPVPLPASPISAFASSEVLRDRLGLPAFDAMTWTSLESSQSGTGAPPPPGPPAVPPPAPPAGDWR